MQESDTDLSDVTTAASISLEIMTLDACYDKLFKSIRYSTFQALMNKGILSNDTVQPLLLLHNQESRRHLLEAIRSAVKVNPSNFRSLIEALQENTSSRDVANKLKSTFQSES